MSMDLDAPVALRAARDSAARALTAPVGVVPQPRDIVAHDQEVELAADVDEVLGAPAATAVELPTQRSGLADVDVAIIAMWDRFKTTACPQAREALILHYAPLVSAVAGRVGMRLPSTVEQADLVSYGMFGLIDAVEKYQTDRAVKFESYASSRIRGAIIDELRAMDWVPRSVRTKARAVDRAHAELEASLHRTPSEEEIARHLHMPLSELRAIYTQLSSVNVAALDELLGGAERTGNVSLGDTLGDDGSDDPASSIEADETTYLLARAIEQLGERERIVVVLYYYEGMTLAEIGRVLGVTESRISQMHTAAMTRLRTRLVDAERF
ncbi:RNA polymerase sigma factor WhiG [Cellulomonas composti]|uniref:RNA polymerase sigma factor n=1 Tax=Cellulomonas composti TaxID=266130 RepID=A0A511J8N4_9CELL|nr:RNA polymerase sigma factor WhiG [Cellulomonas composti]GEL94357.1 hypothetical protein CCO02nite_10150 [Cellulomonas composti]